MAKTKDGRLIVTLKPEITKRIELIDSSPEDWCRNAIYNQLKRDEFESGGAQ